MDPKKLELEKMKQELVEELAAYAGVPVWNGLTNEFHPTQILADFLTIQEHFGSLAGKTLVYMGDARYNMGNSLMVVCAKLGMDFVACTSKKYFPEEELVAYCKKVAEETGASITLTEDVKEATTGADVIYTDVWVSMGEPDEIWEERLTDLMPYQVNAAVMKNAKEQAIFMHCLPAFHNLDTKIGKEMGLFMFSERVGKGLPMWLPKGTALRLRLEDFLKKIQKRYGYQQVITPHIGGKNLYVTSGHYAHYGKDSFQPIHTPEEGEEYMLKPMNCPHHCEIFAWRPRSYKDLPLRLAEFGTVYRYEQSGELHGLTRVRSFTQDDAHVYCRPDQVKDEFIRVMEIIQIIFGALDFDNFEAQISLRDPNDKEKYIGSDEVWEAAEKAIIEACAEKGLKTTTELGEAAFYGPKLDFMVKDALGRRWQLGTIQVDYNLPERFQLEYVGEDNQKHRPVMIHRAPFGSMERFVAVLIEHTAGRFPLWLSPEQVVILPVSEKYNEYAYKLQQYFDSQEVRAEVDDRNEKIGRKIRDNEVKHIPYLLIVGEKEQSEGTVSFRRQGGGEQGTLKFEDFANKINEEVRNMVEKY